MTALSREALARIINPEGWDLVDEFGLAEKNASAYAACTRSSLRTADAILAASKELHRISSHNHSPLAPALVPCGERRLADGTLVGECQLEPIISLARMEGACDMAVTVEAIKCCDTETGDHDNHGCDGTLARSHVVDVMGRKIEDLQKKAGIRG